MDFGFTNAFLNRDALFPWVIILVVWEIAWKGLALWRAAQHKQRNWFIAILIVNTLGILPIVYLKFFQKQK